VSETYTLLEYEETRTSRRSWDLLTKKRLRRYPRWKE